MPQDVAGYVAVAAGGLRARLAFTPRSHFSVASAPSCAIMEAIIAVL